MAEYATRRSIARRTTSFLSRGGVAKIPVGGGILALTFGIPVAAGTAAAAPANSSSGAQPSGEHAQITEHASPLSAQDMGVHLYEATSGVRANAQEQDDNVYVHWNFASAPNITNTQQIMTPLTNSPSTFWASTWGFDGGNGGYIGLQTNGIAGGDTAIFSLFGGTAGSPGSGAVTCQSSSESAEQCFQKYSFVDDDAYRYDVTYAGSNSSGELWQGAIFNFTTGVETTIGTITVPASSGDMQPPENFTEYFGPQEACGTTGTSEVQWTPPAANGNPTSGYEYYSTYNSYSYGGDTCSGAYVITGENGSQPYVDVKLGGQFD